VGNILVVRTTARDKLAQAGRPHVPNSLLARATEAALTSKQRARPWRARAGVAWGRGRGALGACGGESIRAREGATGGRAGGGGRRWGCGASAEGEICFSLVCQLEYAAFL